MNLTSGSLCLYYCAKEFGPIAAAASAAASGFDPSMFTQMMSAGAVTSNTLASDLGRSHIVDLEEDQLPLTSPAHNLLKKKNLNQENHPKYSFINRYGNTILEIFLNHCALLPSI